MKKNTKQRLFEVMGRLDPSFKRLNENIGGNVVRSTNTDSPTLDLNKAYIQNRFKPVGIWYEIDDNWKGWCSYQMPEWIKKYDIILDIDMTNILRMNDEKTVFEFIEKYQKNDLLGGLLKNVDWVRVSNDYKGIELTDVDSLKHGELGMVQWVDTWDVDSGCIWDLSAIKNYSVKDCIEYGIEDN